MRLDVFGRFQLEVERSADGWKVLRVGQGIGRPEPDLQVPAELGEDDVIRYLEDLMHELARPGDRIRRLR